MAEPSIRQALAAAMSEAQPTEQLGGGVAPFGLRNSGQAAKGLGYFGRIPTQDGSVATELSSEFEYNGQPVEHPLLVPTLEADEISHLVSGGEPTRGIYDKAQRHAIARILKGESPFAGPADLRMQVSP